jgi:DNA ligase-associated metallophosphoesterase
LIDVIKTYAPMRVIALGDSFHDQAARDHLAENETLGQAMDRVPEWIWVAGNHDPGKSSKIGGNWVDEILIDRMVFRHQAIERPRALEISGHFHPKAGLRLRGRKISGKCFIHDHHRLIMPAFGAFTGGLNITDPVFDQLMVAPFVVKMITRSGLTTVSSARLAA